MSYRDLKAEFDAAKEGQTYEKEIDFRYWLLRLLFEIAGNLDSMVVAYRELVKLQKEKMQK